MAYNLQPLITILEQILNPQQKQWILDHKKPQLQSLLQRAASLQQILEKSPLTKIQSLESQMRDAAHEAEDMIESHMIDQMLSNPEGVSFTFSTPDLQQVTRQLDYVMDQVVKLIEERTGSSSSCVSLSRDLTSKSMVDEELVGVGEALLQLKDRLIGKQSKLEIVPIVGMGGIGKTTLARKLYKDAPIREHFMYRAWTTISQDHNMQTFLSSLLFEQYMEKGKDELKGILYRNLYGRRYIIVLDDIWSTKFWDEIRNCFPDNNNGSRILITTRDSDVAKYVSSQSVQHQVELLNKSESWDLLRQIVFGEEDCPHLLRGIGETIASDCGGLPLALNVIGGLLSKVQGSQDVWETIAHDVKSAIADSDDRFSAILSLSYSHLPNHLRPCFLYMAAFPEDYEIKATKLIRLWVAEGFVKSDGDKSLEEEAEDWLKALVERNLVLVQQYEYGKPKICRMHDLLRDLCIRKSNEEKFLLVQNGTFSNPRRVCFHASHGLLEDDNASAESMSLARSFMCIGLTKDEILPRVFLALRLVRVLDIIARRFKEFPTEILQLVNLRFLAVSCHSGIPSGITRLRNLQTLNANLYPGHLPSEILEMSELRHVELSTIINIDEDDMKKIVPNKLQTISPIVLTPSLLRRGFLESIPDIKDLVICYHEDLTSTSVDLTHLHKLEALAIHYLPSNEEALSTFRFPRDLRKLALDDCVIFPSAMTTLCALPNLEVLKIECCRFEDAYDEELVVAEGDEFRSLQFLHIISLDMARWRANETNFPRLRHLRLERCCFLQEIPSGVGEIPTLQLIELNYCGESVEASAKQIQEVQQSEYDNYGLQLRINLND